MEEIKEFIRLQWGYLVLLSGIVLVVYLNTLSNGFVADDRGIILHIPSLTFGDMFTRWYAFRDSMYLLLYKVGGFNGTLFHLPNILFHLGNVLVIYFLLSRTTKFAIALLASIIFAVHPILVESVAWVSGGIYAQYSFFFLLSFTSFILSRGRGRGYIFSLIFYALMLLSSEKSITLAFVFPLYELLFGDLRKNWYRFLPYFFMSAVRGYLQVSVIAERRENFLSDSPPDQFILNPFFQIPIAITSYFELIFWPDKLTLYHTEMTFTTLQYILRLIVFLGFVGLAIFSYIKNRFLFFWLCFFIIFLSLTLTPLGISWIVAERYVYLGTLGIFIAVAFGFDKIMRVARFRSFAIAFFVIIIMILSIRTIARNVDWANEDNLWLSAARTSPSSSQNHNNLGDYYGRHKDLENSVREFKLAIQLKPNYADAHHNLGNAYRDMGRFDDAIVQYEKALSFNPNIWQSYQNIAAIYYQQGKFTQALEYVEKGLTIEPQNPALYLTRGIILLKLKRLEEAKEIFLAILRIDPTNQLALEGLKEIESPK